MKPAAFEYLRAGSVPEAVALLAEPEARALAGGQSLVPLMNLRLARPALLVDLNHLAELDFIESKNGDVVIGAMCRHRRLEVDDTVRERVPLLAEAAALIGHPAIRNRGTLGGSLAHGDPAAEFGAALLALGATVRVRGSGGAREVPVRHLFEGFFSTSLNTTELIIDIVVPRQLAGEGSAFVEFAPRRGDFAVAGIATRVQRDQSGACTTARAAGCGLSSTPVDLSDTVEILVGEKSLRDDTLREVAARVARAFEPIADVHATALDRVELAQNLIVRALRRAWDRSRGVA